MKGGGLELLNPINSKYPFTCIMYSRKVKDRRESHFELFQKVMTVGTSVSISGCVKIIPTAVCSIRIKIHSNLRQNIT